MNRDDVIRMAREAGFEELFKDSHDWVCFTEEIERFAALVAAAENEACAKVADQGAKYNRYVSKQISIAIRARRKE